MRKVTSIMTHFQLFSRSCFSDEISTCEYPVSGTVLPNIKNDYFDGRPYQPAKASQMIKQLIWGQQVPSPSFFYHG